MCFCLLETHYSVLDLVHQCYWGHNSDDSYFLSALGGIILLSSGFPCVFISLPSVYITIPL